MHALDVPEVLILIATHLKKPDLARACRVSKTWLAPFTEQLWRSIEPRDFADRGGSDHALLKIVPKYEAFIRELSCSRFILLEYFDPGPNLSRLTSFRSHDVRLESVDRIQEILARNPALEELAVYCLNDIPEDKVISLVQAVTQLKNLRALEFATNWACEDDLVESLVESLPLLSHLQLTVWESQDLAESYLSNSSHQGGDGGNGETTDIVPVSRAQLQLKTLRTQLPWRFFHSVIKLLESCPLLEMLDWEDPHQISGPGIPDLGRFARALHQSCPRLSDLLIGSEWLDPSYFYYLLSLSSPLVRKPVSASLEASWLPLRLLFLTQRSMEDDQVLDVVWSGREVLQETLETLTLCDGGWGSNQTKGSIVVKILETFKKLRHLEMKSMVVEVEDFFHEDEAFLDNEEGDDDYDEHEGLEGGTHMSLSAAPLPLPHLRYRFPQIRTWASEEIKSLEFSIQGPDRNWCPPAVVGTSWSNDRCPAVVEDANIRATYPWYSRIKAQLDRYPKLDQSGIRLDTRTPPNLTSYY